MQISSCTADSFVEHLKDVLICCMLPLAMCRGQGYDGAAAMSGKFCSAGTQIRQLEPRAIPVHCLAHCLKLCFQDVCKSLRPIKDALEPVGEAVHITKSPKRAEIFSSKQLDEPPETGYKNLKPLSPTRWTVRTDAIEAVLDN